MASVAILVQTLVVISAPLQHFSVRRAPRQDLLFVPTHRSRTMPYSRPSDPARRPAWLAASGEHLTLHPQLRMSGPQGGQPCVPAPDVLAELGTDGGSWKQSNEDSGSGFTALWQFSHHQEAKKVYRKQLRGKPCFAGLRQQHESLAHQECGDGRQRTCTVAPIGEALSALRKKGASVLVRLPKPGKQGDSDYLLPLGARPTAAPPGLEDSLSPWALDAAALDKVQSLRPGGIIDYDGALYSSAACDEVKGILFSF
jgi:hypothetical protein